jgi:hypothetical protein
MYKIPTILAYQVYYVTFFIPLLFGMSLLQMFLFLDTYM